MPVSKGAGGGDVGAGVGISVGKMVGVAGVKGVGDEVGVAAGAVALESTVGVASLRAGTMLMYAAPCPQAAKRIPPRSTKEIISLRLETNVGINPTKYLEPG